MPDPLPSRPGRRPEKFTAIAFDLDGTLVDTLPAMHATFNGVLAPIVGRPIPMEEVRGRLGPRALEIMRTYDPANADALLQTYLDYYLTVHLDHSVLYPGMLDVVEELARRGHRLGIVTSKRRKTAIPTLEHFGLMKHFRVVVTDDDVPALKPDPRPVRMTAEGMGVDPAEVIVIGDNPTDIAAAHAAGAAGGAAVWGYYPDEVAAGADFVFRSARDILDVCA